MSKLSITAALNEANGRTPRPIRIGRKHTIYWRLYLSDQEVRDFSSYHKAWASRNQIVAQTALQLMGHPTSIEAAVEAGCRSPREIVTATIKKD